MSAYIGSFIQGLTHRLPGDAPVITVLIIPEIYIMPGTVHGHSVWPEACDPVILRRPVKHIAARRVIHDGAQILHTNVIRPGNRQVHTIDHIFPLLIVKMSVSHAIPSLISGTPQTEAACRFSI